MQSRYMAMGLTVAAVVVGGCGENAPNTPEQTWHVGEPQWVKVEEPAHNSNDFFDEGDACVMDRGATLALSGGEMSYSDSSLRGGTACPDTQVDISRQQAESQDKRYDEYVSRRREIAKEIGKMGPAVGKAYRVRDWAEAVVNPEPVKVFKRSRSRWDPSGKYLVKIVSYGDHCLAIGEAEKIGQLSDGESVVRLQSSLPKQENGAGDTCPTGVLYIASGSQADLYTSPQAR